MERSQLFDLMGELKLYGMKGLPSAAESQEAASTAREQGANASGLEHTVQLISAPSSVGAEDQIEFQVDDRIAPRDGACFNRFEKETHGSIAGDPLEDRGWCFKFGNECCPDDLSSELNVAPSTRLRSGLEFHWPMDKATGMQVCWVWL
jgi:hypothetical protein